MALRFAGTLDRSVVVAATRQAAVLVGRPEVATAWDRESSCAGMTVGALAVHLASQSLNVVRLVPAGAPDDAEVIGIEEHYARAAWVREDLDGPFNTSIRDGSQAGAAAGPDGVLADLGQAVDALPGVLGAAPDTVLIPWQGWALATDDFLVTRLMELVVHTDDLAASVAVEVPVAPPGALEPVLRLLTTLAVRRHGQDAVVRTLSRPQRAPGPISAF